MKISRARVLIAAAGAAAVTLIASLLIAVQPAQAAVGLRIANGRLVEANGTPFIMRGTSHAHTWFTSRATPSVASNTASYVSGANTDSGDTLAAAI